MLDEVPHIFEAVFACTLEVKARFLFVKHSVCYTAGLVMEERFFWRQMITKNFEDYPEHRLKFFSLLRAIASHCFRALFKLSGQVPIVFVFVSLLSPEEIVR